ncbi:CDP-alcohol phosphatidyltransferase family protein, partial [bacterium]|nr:CDP-alcohol phosphatidyltransferase family protein [bacterium]
MKGPIFTVSNFMSFLRVAFVWPIAVLLYKDTPAANYGAIALCWAAAATDVLDGYFARKFNQVSDLGKLVDPVADKLLIGVVALLLMLLRDFPWWLFGIIVCRDLVIMIASLLLIEKTQKIHMSNYYGKFAVVAISMTMLMYLLEWEKT